MGPRGKRALIAISGALLLLGVLMVSFFALLAPLGCEDADGASDTVLCDAERGSDWRALQGVIIVALILACVVGLMLALKQISGVALLVPLIAAAPAFWAVFAIYDIEVGDRPLPKMSDVRFGARSCVSPCPGGFPVSFALDGPARIQVSLTPPYEDVGNKTYEDFVIGMDQPEGKAGYDFDEGRHSIRVNTRIVNPPSRTGPAPVGRYKFAISAEPQDAGGQRVRTLGAFTAAVRVWRPSP